MIGALVASLTLLSCSSSSGRLGGRGGGGGTTGAPTIVLSEIMYHPVLEEGYEADPDPHEWLEIGNAGDAAVELEGWALTEGVQFTFGPLTLEPDSAVVVVQSREDFEAIHDLDPALIAGEFEGRLSNAGEAISLSNPAGVVVDTVEYSDQAPWPMGADALGVGEGWLPSFELPEEDHRYRGRSIARVVFDGDGSDPGAWEASDLDGETPGRLRPSGRTVPIPVATDISVDGQGDVPLTPGEPIVVRFNAPSDLPTARVEWFVDDLDTELESSEFVFAQSDGDGWSATLPGQPAESIVRFRLTADAGDGSEVMAPREGDPRAWFGAFVGDPVPGNTRAYKVYISPANLIRMSRNIQDGRVLPGGCTPNPTWNDREEAVFVWGSEVYDIRVRFQGSRFQRRNGPQIPWTEPNVVPVRSWRIAFPKYQPFQGLRVFTLNKLIQSCPGLEARVGFQLYGEAGIPAPQTRYARLFLNGAYYNYALEIERPGDELYGRWQEEQEALDPTRTVEPGVGHLVKAVGCNCDEGPFGWGDERLLGPNCGYSTSERYAATYDRKTWQDWGTPDGIQTLIEGLHEARAGTDAELRAYLEANYDVAHILTHIAVTNWSGPWDDMLHNHYLYQRRSDGRWATAPWDLDLTFGPQRGPQSSLYTGLEGVGGAWWNRTKDSFLRVFLPEYEARLLELNNTVLHPDNVLTKLTEAFEDIDLAEAQATPSGPACDYTAREDVFRNFAIERHDYVNAQLAP